MAPGSGFRCGFSFAENYREFREAHLATARQVNQIIARHLSLAEGKLVWCADVLRAARLLPAARGQPVDLSHKEVALLLLAAAIGAPACNKPWVLSQWCEVADDSGTKLQDALAWWLQRPEALIRLTVNLTAPTATAIEEFCDTPTVRQFGSAETLERTITISGDTVRSIACALNNAPHVRAGRPRIREKIYA